jgi:hypothetical protein
MEEEGGGKMKVKNKVNFTNKIDMETINEELKSMIDNRLHIKLLKNYSLQQIAKKIKCTWYAARRIYQQNKTPSKWQTKYNLWLLIKKEVKKE